MLKPSTSACTPRISISKICEQYQSEMADYSRLMLTNLERAAKRSRSVKQLSVERVP
ncbi:hypothetical protein AAEH84_05965 [Shewanella indica]|uniref:hypothetical protein n=1 Tax=Shewanella indica TaxID=768528 RepID=UPI00313E0714